MKKLFYGGPIRTMEREDDRPEALLTDGATIEAVGSLDELSARAPGAERIDLGGRALLPGFIDPHSHITQFAGTLRLAPLAECRTMEDVAARLTEAKRRLPAGSWVIGFGYDNNTIGAHPTRDVLDRVSAEQPVLVAHVSGHMGAANSAALRELGVTAETPDPAGGRIGRREGSREPSGFLEENAFIQIAGKAPAASEEQQLALLEEAQQIYFSYGITTAQDGKSTAAECGLLAAAARQNRLAIDVVSYVDYFASLESVRNYSEYVGKYNDKYKIGGVKIFLDGSPQGRTAWMTEPYRDAPDGYRGYPVHTDGEVREAAEFAAANGLQLLAHCNGDAAAAQLLAACEGQGLRRPVMIHAQLLRRDQLPALRALGMIPSFFVAHTFHWGDVHLQNFGPERADFISPLGSAARLGIPFTLHQDTPVLPPDMLETVWCAACRETRAGVGLAESERVGPYAALRAVTANAAHQYFEEDEKGTLAPGKRADLVLLDRDPLAVPPDELRSVRVLETVKDGETVFRAAV